MKKETILKALRQKVSEQPMAPKMGLSLVDLAPGQALVKMADRPSPHQYPGRHSRHRHICPDR